MNYETFSTSTLLKMLGRDAVQDQAIEDELFRRERGVTRKPDTQTMSLFAADTAASTPKENSSTLNQRLTN